MIPPIAIENQARLVVDLLLAWAVVAGPLAVLICAWIVWKKL